MAGAEGALYVIALGGIGDCLPFAGLAAGIARRCSCRVRFLTHARWVPFLPLDTVHRRAIRGDEKNSAPPSSAVRWRAVTLGGVQIEVSTVSWPACALPPGQVRADVGEEERALANMFSGARGVVAGLCAPHALAAARHAGVPCVLVSASPPRPMSGAAGAAISPSYDRCLRALCARPPWCPACVSAGDVRFFLAAEAASDCTRPLAGPGARACPVCDTAAAEAVPLLLLLSPTLCDSALLARARVHVLGRAHPLAGPEVLPPASRKRPRGAPARHAVLDEISVLRASLHGGRPRVLVTFGSMAELGIVPRDAAAAVGRAVADRAGPTAHAPAVLCVLPAGVGSAGGAGGGDGQGRGLRDLGRGAFACHTPLPLERALELWAPACAVHHGGAGTVAACAACGVPQVVLPCAYDQHGWGRRVRELGIGTVVETPPGAELPLARVAEACTRLIASPAASRAAQRAVARSLRAEPCGAEAAAAVLVLRWALAPPESRHGESPRARAESMMAAAAPVDAAAAVAPELDQGGAAANAAAAGVGALSASVAAAAEAGADLAAAGAWEAAHCAAVSACAALREEEERTRGPLPPSRAVDPLWPPLAAAEYDMMERDLGKYVLYGAALAHTLMRAKCALGPAPGARRIRVLVLGAGRGPLVHAVLTAAARVGVGARVHVVAADANPGAAESLRATFAGPIAAGVVEVAPPFALVPGADPPPPWRAAFDVVASELLGAGGDNEGMPEILAAAAARVLSPRATAAAAACQTMCAHGRWGPVPPPGPETEEERDSAPELRLSRPPCPFVPCSYAVFALPLDADSVPVRALAALGRSCHAAYLASASHGLRPLAVGAACLWRSPTWVSAPLRSGSAEFVATADGRVGAIALFFSSRLCDAPLWLDTRPVRIGGSGVGAYHWESLLLPLASQIAVRRGHTISCSVQRRAETVSSPAGAHSTMVWLEWGARVLVDALDRDGTCGEAPLAHNLGGWQQRWTVP